MARLRALAGAILAAAQVLAFAAPASANGGTAEVRAFHNSPDTPAVDIYVNGAKTLSDVTYGTLSDYLEVPRGTYTCRSRWPRPPRATRPPSRPTCASAADRSPSPPSAR